MVIVGAASCPWAWAAIRWSFVRVRPPAVAKGKGRLSEVTPPLFP